ncbi:MAG: hypothetical protein AB4042_04425 [Leptolyngbyaceae cyanobacterium]
MIHDALDNLWLPVLAASLGGISRVPSLVVLRQVARLILLAIALPVAQRAVQSVVQQR